jgi:hypothetical protein
MSTPTPSRAPSSTATYGPATGSWHPPPTTATWPPSDRLLLACRPPRHEPSPANWVIDQATMRPPVDFDVDETVLATLGIVGDIDARTVELPGGQLLALSRIDRSEAHRRQACDLGPVIDRPLLEALAGLPLGEPVRWDDLDPLAQVVLDGAPAGCVDASAATVTRLYTPVLDPVMFIAALAGERSVQEISLFAADTQRLLVGEKPPAAKVAQEARQLGIGLALASRHDLEVVQPASRRFVKPGPRRWFVQERLWAMAPQLAADQRLS